MNGDILGHQGQGGDFRLGQIWTHFTNSQNCASRLDRIMHFVSYCTFFYILKCKIEASPPPIFFGLGVHVLSRGGYVSSLCC